MVQDIWRQLAQRYDWQMVGSADEIAFVRQVQAELAAHSAGPLTTPLIRQAVYRIYSEYLYRGLLAGHEQAAAELRRVCWLAARKRGADEHEADEVAQETISRVLTKLDDLLEPRALTTWMLMIMRTVRRDMRNATPEQGSIEDMLAYERLDTLADEHDMERDIEQRMISTALAHYLSEMLPNALERLVLLRIVLLGDKPRDVAADVGLPLHRTRLAKSRALARLRNDPASLERLLRIIGDDDLLTHNLPDD
ncbi:MAG: sigma-70 family RNA polymerase sigma factor [Chloroflexaceae bacterium]|nr:sigma-70 family RNA polymerase sigma factor [Chloroflexaceae bacterium]